MSRYPKPKTARKIVWCLLSIGAIIGLIGSYSSDILFVIGIVLMICAILTHFIFYRCPHCGRFLDRSTGEFCPCCGKEIDQ